MDATWHRAGFVTIRDRTAKLQPTRPPSVSPSVTHNTVGGSVSVAPTVIPTPRAWRRNDRLALLGPSSTSPAATTPAPLVIMASELSAAIWILEIATGVIRDRVSEWETEAGG